MPKWAHLEYTEDETKRSLSVGVTDDRKRMYVGYRTRRGDGDVMQFRKKEAAELGGAIMNWAQHQMVEDDG